MPLATHAHVPKERVHHFVNTPPGLIEAARGVTGSPYPYSVFADIEENYTGPWEQRHHQRKTIFDPVDELCALGVSQVIATNVAKSNLWRCHGKR